MKRTPLRRKTAIKRYRKKARPGRLKGEALTELRRQCFSRDCYRCVACGKSVTWDTGHMAHIRAKRRHGDSLANVRTLCEEHHRLEHLWGKEMKKPCAPKNQANS